MTAGSLPHGLRRALADRAALGQHVDALAEPHDQPQVVVDDQHARSPRSSRTALIVSSRSSDSRSFMPGGGLVQQQEARAARERARDLDAALLAVRQRRRHAVGDPQSSPICFSSGATAASGPRRRPRRRPRRSRRPSSRANRRICWNVRPDAEPGEHVRPLPGRRSPGRPRRARPSAAARRSRRSGASSCRCRWARSGRRSRPRATVRSTPSSARRPRNCFDDVLERERRPGRRRGRRYGSHGA